MKVYFITGCSSSLGFGISFVNNILENGDYVAATTRSIENLMKNVKGNLINNENFLPIEMDVTDEKSVKKALEETFQKFNKIDVVINNSGFGFMGAITDFSDKEVRQQFDVNFFGPLNVIRNSIKYLKLNENGSKIVNISSICGIYSQLVSFGVYSASKASLSMLTEAIQPEIEKFNIKVSNVMPGYYRTNFLDPKYIKVIENKDLKGYKEVYDSVNHHINNINHNQPGDPDKCVKSILLNISSENPILNFVVGQDAINMVNNKIQRLKDDMNNSLKYDNHKTDI